MRYEFNCSEHEEYGGKGWCPAWMKQADPLGGMGVAHDIMEHPAKDQGTVEDEIRAFGAALYIRHEGGWWHRQGQRTTDWAGNTSYEIFEFLRKWADGDGDWLRGAPSKRTTALDAELEDQMVTCWASLSKHIGDELSDRSDAATRRQCRQGLTGGHEQRFRQLVREGYRMACKRFHRADPGSLAHLFDQIAKQADRELQHAEIGYGRLVVTLNRKTLDYQVHLAEISGDDY